MNSTRLGAFARSHPIVWQAMLWALPAIAVGAILRVLLLSYMPYAFWGADSASYYRFAHTLLEKGYISLDAKRRFIYPILMVPVSLLPGAPLKWVAWLQHGLGIASIVPLAYVVRSTLVHWRLWIVPVTALYAGLPLFLWYEHELLGEVILFAALLWAFAGWVAWIRQCDLERGRRMFWWFFVPFAIFILTKPSGRFVWPGILLGLVFVLAWRRLAWRQMAALAVLIPLTLTVGARAQGAWLLYTAAFPLTQLETPQHAAYKAEIRGLVEPLYRERDIYYQRESEPFEFLDKVKEQHGYPLWQALAKNEKLKSRICMDLAVEGITAHPLQFLTFGAQRVAASANFSEFKVHRFYSKRLRERAGEFYEEAVRQELHLFRKAYGLPSRGPLPPWEEFIAGVDPAPQSWRARAVQGWCEAFGTRLDFLRWPTEKSARTLRNVRPTFLGWVLAAGIVLAFLPRSSRTLGVWTLVALGYVFGVFIVSQENPRYFGPVWPVLIMLLALPLDAVVRSIWRRGASVT